jgi:hypothetical protein
MLQNSIMTGKIDKNIRFVGDVQVNVRSCVELVECTCLGRTFFAEILTIFYAKIERLRN